MKKILTLFTFSLLATIAFAQKLEVTYQETINIDKDEFKKNMKVETSGSVSLPSDFYDNFFKSLSEPKDFTLVINDNESTYKKVEKISNNQGNNGFSVSMSMSGGGNGLYKNLLTKEFAKSVNLMDKPYLIKDKLTEYKWQLSRETKKIIGFDVKKATAIIDSTKSVVAWYAPSIAIKDGPAMYNGLPGLILELEIISTKNTSNKGFGNVTIKATEVKEVADMKPIEKPKEKNVISEKEFETMSKKQMERFKKMRSEGVDKD
ncbi:GLPGLI family protein [Empedobacter falsenii]|uniref:GLPGLI family protein n=1 Tax=Empedobacter falsenii TaxID=343874 RepID=A0ABY8VCV7_9FLAO|nr:GLPGLI family protein [Empedobacter falsenii]WIH98595.1 GLPGLI family protein [Empedobacter falsenii]